MMLQRGLVLAIAAILTLGSQAAAQTFHREELRVPLAEAGPRGLETLLVRPNEPGRFPLIIIAHGSPRDRSARPKMTPLAMLPQAMEFARRGFAVAVVMRRGYGDSGGDFVEGTGPCNNPDYIASGFTSAADLRAAITHLSRRTDIDATRNLVVGRSAGGFAAVALSTNPPSGLIAAISFAGGRGSQVDGQVCRADRLVAAFGTFGQRSRLPMLWVYAENDRYFGPELAQRFRDVFVLAGGKTEFVQAPPFGQDGHTLFSPSGIPVWTPHVDKFLKSQNLVLRDEPLPLPTASLPPPEQLSTEGRKAFESFLVAAPHKAFAVAPGGAYGWQSEQRTVEEAKAGALRNCRKHAADCRVAAVDDAALP